MQRATCTRERATCRHGKDSTIDLMSSHNQNLKKKLESKHESLKQLQSGRRCNMHNPACRAAEAARLRRDGACCSTGRHVATYDSMLQLRQPERCRIRLRRDGTGRIGESHPLEACACADGRKLEAKLSKPAAQCYTPGAMRNSGRRSREPLIVGGRTGTDNENTGTDHGYTGTDNLYTCTDEPHSGRRSSRTSRRISSAQQRLTRTR